MNRTLPTLLAIILISVASQTASAAEDHFKGKTIKIMVGSGAGGGAYDVHARMLSRHYGKHISGNPKFIVQNMPAGRGMAATNHIFNIAPKDGTEIGLFNRNTLFAPILGDNIAKYTIEDFNWIGTPASYSDNAWVFFIRSELPQQNFEELRRASPPLNIANGGNVVVRVMQEALGAKIKLIGGYQTSEIDLAFERDEIDGFGSGYTNILGQHPHWLEKNMVRILVQFARSTRLPALPNVPTGRELAQTPEDLALLEMAEMPIMLGFPVAAPPLVPAPVVAVLRSAFKSTMLDPEYRADSERTKTEYSPKYHEELSADMLRMVQAPTGVKERFKKLADQEARGG